MQSNATMPIRWIGRGLRWVMALLSGAIAIYAFRYLPRIGPLASDILRNAYARPWLDVHIAGAATALLLLPIQLLPNVRTRWPRVHRVVGRIYVLGCLAGGVGGFIMAFGSTAGPIATVGFGSLAVLWVITNIQGWRMAVAQRFAEHRAGMIRSFALTFAAVVLRLLLPVAPLVGLPFLDGYRALSFLSWLPSLMLAELYLADRLPSLRRVESIDLFVAGSHNYASHEQTP